VEIHWLTSLPFGKPNGDDLGNPKTVVFGGTRRLRISAQCIRRAWRMSPVFREAFDPAELAERTDTLPQDVRALLGNSFDAEAQRGLDVLLSSLGKKSGSAAKDAGDGIVEEMEGQRDRGLEEEEETGSADPTRTAHLLFLTQPEVAEVAAFARAHEAELRLIEAKGKGKVDQGAVKELRNLLRVHLEEHTDRNAICVGLFGRFVTSDELDTVTAALNVAHLFGVGRADVEGDYFTGLSDRTGRAGMLGTTDFGAACYYGYATCDVPLLGRNLGARSPQGRVVDDAARALARKALVPLTRAIATVVPTGKKSGTAPNARAEFVEVVFRSTAPLSYANSFLRAVDGREAGGDMMAAAIARLCRHRDTMEAAYGDTVLARFVLALNDNVPQTVKVAGVAGQEVKTLAELTSALAQALVKAGA
jgi:CRISPR system Cascade subunit CasC